MPPPITGIINKLCIDVGSANYFTVSGSYLIRYIFHAKHWKIPSYVKQHATCTPDTILMIIFQANPGR